MTKQTTSSTRAPAIQDDLVLRAQAAHRRAERALDLMFRNFGRYEDDSRANRLLELALEREQETWVAAFGSPKLRELAAAASARDEAGRLLNPWLHAARAVEQRVLAEWQRARPRDCARAPGQEWSAVPLMYDAPPNAFRAFVQRQTLARATAAADAAWAKYDRAQCTPASPTTWKTRWEKRLAGDLHEKLRLALTREWNAWIAVHGSHALKQLPSFNPRNGRWGEEALHGMRQLGVEWLTKEYPGWQLKQGYHADGHRPRLGTDYSVRHIEASHQRALEAALGGALGAAMSEARRVDPTAELEVFTESGQSCDRGPYVFAAVVERRLPGSWVREPVMLVFGASVQRELNVLAEREMGVAPSAREQDAEAPAGRAKPAELAVEGRASVNPPAPKTLLKEARMQKDRSADLKDLLHEIRMLAIEAGSGTRFGPNPERAIGEEVAYRHVESLIEERLDRALGKTPEPLDARAQMRARLEQEFGKPVLPVPQGVAVAGTLERIEATESGRATAIVVGAEATHVLSVAQQAKQLVGQKVELRNAAGVVRLAAAPTTIAVTRESISRAAEQQHGRPLLGNFHGAEGRLDCVVGDAAGAHWAVVVGAQSVHVVRSSEAARESVGERVTLEAGKSGFELRASTPSLGR